MRISNARFKEAHSSELFYIIKGILATKIRKKKKGCFGFQYTGYKHTSRYSALRVLTIPL